MANKDFQRVTQFDGTEVGVKRFVYCATEYALISMGILCLDGDD